MTQTTHPLTLLLAAPAEFLPAATERLQADGRFHLVGQVTTRAALVAATRAEEPELVLADGTLFSAAAEVSELLAQHAGALFLIPPLPALADAPAHLHLVPESVTGFEALTSELYQVGLQARQQAIAARGGHALYSHFPSPLARLAGAHTQTIAVWSPQGGSGKTTLACALALEAASRQRSTLLVGLGLPDPLPLLCGLRSEPNLASWLAARTPQTLKAAAQKLETVDVLAGLADLRAAGSLLAEETVVAQLVEQAVAAGYTTVVLDVSAQALAPQALRAAQEVVLVATPTLPGVLHAVEAVRVCDQQRPLHLVLNRARPESLPPQDLFRMGRETLRHFPPVAATLAEDPAIARAEQARALPSLHSAALRKVSQQVGDTLFGSQPRAVPPAPPAGARFAPGSTVAEGRTLNLGLVRLRWT